MLIKRLFVYLLYHFATMGYFVSHTHLHIPLYYIYNYLTHLIKNIV